MGNAPWDSDLTPTIPSDAITRLVTRTKKSSQERVSLSAVCVHEVLNLDGVRVTNSDLVMAAAQKVVARYFDVYEHRYRAILTNANEDTELALARANAEVFRLRRAFMDYISSGDMEVLSKEILK